MPWISGASVSKQHFLLAVIPKRQSQTLLYAMCQMSWHEMLIVTVPCPPHSSRCTVVNGICCIYTGNWDDSNYLFHKSEYFRSSCFWYKCCFSDGNTSKPDLIWFARSTGAASLLRNGHVRSESRMRLSTSITDSNAGGCIKDFFNYSDVSSRSTLTFAKMTLYQLISPCEILSAQ